MARVCGSEQVDNARFSGTRFGGALLGGRPGGWLSGGYVRVVCVWPGATQTVVGSLRVPDHGRRYNDDSVTGKPSTDAKVEAVSEWA